MDGSTKRQGTAALALGALGVVYGDIGTSPLYTVKETFGPATGLALDAANLVGAASVIVWALMLVVTLKYVILILRADNRGEGGIIALTALAAAAAGRTARRRNALILVGIAGAALFYGDSVITPAISVLSAVEGLDVAAPGLQAYVLPLSAGILVALFAMQSRGTATVGRLFGPVIVLWFSVLAIAGVAQILREPAILAALNPLRAAEFLAANGWGLFVVMGAIVLAVTGAEALYADLGHFGPRPIRLAWAGFVFPALALNYLGQGALLMRDPAALENPFYRLFPESLLIPVVVLATAATVIASQAVISGAYSMTRQAIQLGVLPRMRIFHTSAAEGGQIYLPAVNWMLLAVVLAATLGFGSSSALASAYGIAVTLTMLATTVLTYFVVRHAWKYPGWVALAATGCFVALDLVLVVSCLLKFMQGGWFPILLAAAIFLVMATWKRGREALLDKMHAGDPPLRPLLDSLLSGHLPRPGRTAVFPTADPDAVPHALLHNLRHNGVLHATNVILTVRFHDVPHVSRADALQVERIAEGFWRVRVNCGFLEDPDVPRALADCKAMGLETNPFETSYFLSRETVVPSAGGCMAPWRERLFVALTKTAGSAADFFHIPHHATIELGTRVQI
ncbi:MAG TPA: potassium transporter Kup [Burkholderiales bacterium]|jgi:KUP system potassium uptake protein|nr:potassium transporter Kup [Burkholderiales bacterium]